MTRSSDTFHVARIAVPLSTAPGQRVPVRHEVFDGEAWHPVEMWCRVRSTYRRPSDTTTMLADVAVQVRTTFVGLAPE